MKKSLTDMRSRGTDVKAQKALLRILKNDELSAVTVSQLCAEAGISRGTFYNHYYDIFDVYERLEDEFFHEIILRMDVVKAYSMDSSFFKEMIEFILKNADIVTLILNDLYKNNLLKRAVEFIRNKFMSEYGEQFPEINKDFLNVLFTYTINGAIGVLTQWLRQGMRMPADTVACLIEKFNRIFTSSALSESANIAHFFNKI